MKRNLKVKMGERKLREEWTRLNAKYTKTKTLLEEALSHRYRFELAVLAIATREGTCWCGIKTFKLLAGEEHYLHTVVCDQLYLALYGAERGA